MKKANQIDGTFIIGLLMVAISFLIYLFLSSKTGLNFNDLGVSLINYGVAIAYFIILFITNFRNHRWKLTQYNRKHWIVFLVLFSISAFALNISIRVFEEFTSWLNVYLVLMYSGVLLFCFIEQMPKIFRTVVFFLMGLSVVMSFYFALYLLPLIHIGLLAFFVLGISLHLLVPGILCAYLVYYTFSEAKNLPERISATLGIMLPIAVLVLFLVKWQSVNNEIHQAHASIITRPDNKLPRWILLAQQLENDAFTEMILKGDLTYNSSFFDFSGNELLGNSFRETRKHDPLMAIAMATSMETGLTQEERVKILETRFGARHKSYRKLWSGKDLTTTNILSNIKLFPEYRMAYIEKTISIHNNHRSGWNQQEALYTFFLPAGSVASSLSLWIEGKEEKSRLTTREKADSAYTTIVGVERRDPALLHWHEGNRITVTVFPCTPKEERIFKIGITVPLTKEGNGFLLNNIKFDGPYFNDARETAIIDVSSSEYAKDIVIPNGFERVGETKYQFSGKYDDGWNVKLNLNKLSNNTFSFRGNTYSVKELEKRKIKSRFENIYLDINAEWSDDEITQVLHVFKDKKVYVYHDEILKLTENNKSLLIKILQNNAFSLFPVYLIRNIENSLLITKSTEDSPTINDLKTTDFYSELGDFAKQGKEGIKCFHIGNKLSVLWNTLSELGMVKINKLSLTSVIENAKKSEFEFLLTENNQVPIELSNISIVKIKGESKSKAPDHLLRLFNYKKLMLQSGSKILHDRKYTDSNLIALANEAYIVSPVSSLIVLETQKDYDRFDINKNKDSLGNAIIQSKGAVPEPHEWALIGVSVLIVLGFYLKSRKGV